MAYGHPVNIENTDRFIVASFGNGAAYELIAKDCPGYRSAFLQGDDATQWRADYDAMCEAANCEGTAWYNKTWNDCLAQLICDYLPE